MKKVSFVFLAMLLAVSFQSPAAAFDFTNAEQKTVSKSVSTVSLWEHARIQRGDTLWAYCESFVKKAGLNVLPMACVVTVGKLNGFTTNEEHDFLAPDQKIWLPSLKNEKLAEQEIATPATPEAFGTNISLIREELDLPALLDRIAVNEKRSEELGVNHDFLADEVSQLASANEQRDVTVASLDANVVEMSNRLDSVEAKLTTPASPYLPHAIIGFCVLIILGVLISLIKASRNKGAIAKQSADLQSLKKEVTKGTKALAEGFDKVVEVATNAAQKAETAMQTADQAVKITTFIQDVHIDHHGWQPVNLKKLSVGATARWTVTHEDRVYHLSITRDNDESKLVMVEGIRNGSDAAIPFIMANPSNLRPVIYKALSEGRIEGVKSHQLEAVA